MQVYLSAWPGKSKLCLSSKLISGIIPGTKLIWKCLKHSTTGRCDAMIWEIFNICSVNPIKLYGRTLTKEVYVNINSFVLSPDLLLTFAGVWAGVKVRGPLGFEPFPLLFSINSWSTKPKAAAMQNRFPSFAICHSISTFSSICICSCFYIFHPISFSDFTTLYTAI